MTLHRLAKEFEFANTYEALEKIIKFTTNEDRLKIVLNESDDVYVEPKTGYERALRSIVRENIKDLAKDINKIVGIPVNELTRHIEWWLSVHMYKYVGIWDDTAYETVKKRADSTFLLSLYVSYDSTIYKIKKNRGKK